MKIAFFCSTPYQILISMNIVNTFFDEQKVDLYILNHFNNSHVIAERVSKIPNMFNKVEYVDCARYSESFKSKSRIQLHFKKMIDFFNYKNISDQYFNFPSSYYDEVFFSYPDFIVQIALKSLYSKNKNLRVSLFEDGTGGYTDSIQKVSPIKKIINLVTGSRKILDQYDSILMFKPEMFIGEINSSTEIKKIPTINMNDKNFVKNINIVFSFHPTDIIKEKIIFMDQSFAHIKKGFDESIKDIVEQLDKTNLIIKIHPRNNQKNYENFNIYLKQEIPWEVIALNSNIEDKILISYFSTAAITNKIIFNAEPYIIFLYNLNELKEYYFMTDELKEFSNEIKESYNDPSKVFIPQTIDELKQIISKLKDI